MRIALIFVFLVGFCLRAQVTVLVCFYFDFGSSKLETEFEKSITDLSVNYDLSLIYSIYFVGYADSLVRLSANLRLSKKRARNVYRIAKRGFDNNLNA